MKVFIKGKEFADWKEDITTDNKHQALVITTYYVNRGYDVKVEQVKEVKK